MNTEHVDVVTPSWSSLLPLMLVGYEAAVESANLTQIELFRKEFTRMAKGADIGVYYLHNNTVDSAEV